MFANIGLPGLLFLTGPQNLAVLPAAMASMLMPPPVWFDLIPTLMS